MRSDVQALFPGWWEVRRLQARRDPAGDIVIP